MKSRLLDHLVCPLDSQPLELREWESVSRALSVDDQHRAERAGVPIQSLEHEVQTGVLVNNRLKVLYPIHLGIPRLLVFRTGLSEHFEQVHGSQMRSDFPGFHLPDHESMPGEADVLRTFSSEWLNYDWDGKSYWNLKADAWFQCMDFTLDIESQPVRDKLCLEIGIGIGGVANHMASQNGCELVGVDLGYSVDAAYKHFGQNPFLHIVQASAFRPPFRQQAFDLVYSFGVIHHTFSTETAFRSIARLPKVGGRLFIWVYSPGNENRSIERRLMMSLENVVRPILWQLPERLQGVALAPLVPVYMASQWLRSMRSDGSVVPYGFREAMHAARDRFTPPYVHRHTEEEIAAWFNSSGFNEIQLGATRDWPRNTPIGFYHNSSVYGRKLNHIAIETPTSEPTPG